MTRLPFFILLITTLLSSCTSNEIGQGKDVNPESIYFDYKVFGDIDTQNIAIKLQYRFAGPNGTTLVLSDPSRVELDGFPLNVDSSKMNGAYYEVVKPAKDFKGKHTIVFTDMNKKQYREEFSFQPVLLMANVPDTISRRDLVFELDGLETEDYVRVLLTDTSFASESINRLDTIRNGRILISKADLDAVVNGPVHLELYKENERPVKNGTREGGRFTFSYGLKRDFYLKN